MGHGSKLGELPKIWRSSINIYTMAEASNFKFGTQLGFVKAHRLKLASSNLACSWHLPKPTIKAHPEEKWSWSCAREDPKYLGFPFNISATATLST